jgi:hypothetical protein
MKETKASGYYEVNPGDGINRTFWGQAVTLGLKWFLDVEGVDIRGIQVAGLDVRCWLQADIQSPKIDFRLYEALAVKVVLVCVA